MNARWYKRCGADFIHGTMMLTLEEKGAYSLCLDLIYDRGGPIPDDARWLAGVCGVSLRKWNAIRERLLSLGKIASDGTHISNVRAGLELASAELHARKLSESGAKGGRKRAENAVEAKEVNDLAEAPLKLLREEESREEPPKALRKRSAGGRHFIPEDWQPPSVAELPPRARACAEQWTSASYATEAEAFVCYWRSERKMKADWGGTWANRVIARHSAIMRDQKFGNAPTDAPARNLTAEERIAQLRRMIPHYEQAGRTGDAEKSRQLIAQLEKPPDPAMASNVASIVQRIGRA